MDRSRLLAIGLACGLALACGETNEADRAASGTAMVRESDPATANSSPVVSSVRFVPATAVPGQALQVVAAAADPDGDSVTLLYEWELDGRRVLADGPEIIVPPARKGSRLGVTVIATDGVEEGAPFYLDIRIGNRAPRITQIDVQTVQQEDDLPIEPHWEVHPTVDDPDGDHTSIRFEWIVNGKVSEVSSSRFEKSSVRRGDEVRVVVTAFDGESESLPLESAAIVVGNSVPEIISSPPDLDSSGVFLYEPEVTDRDHDRVFRFRLIKAPEGMTVDQLSGALSWRPGLEDEGDHSVELEVADAHGGHSSQLFEVSVQVGESAPGPASVR